MDAATGKLVPVLPKASSKSHRIGGVFAGPAIKNKLFWLGSYERAWSPGAVTSTVSLLPKQFRTPQVDQQLPDAAARTAFIKSIIDRYPDVQPNNTVNNPYGSISVKPSSSNVVVINAVLSSDKVEVDNNLVGNRVEIQSHLLPGADSQSGRVDYEIQVPADASITLHSSTGPLRAERLHGDVTLEGAAATVEIHDISGGNPFG